MRILLISNYSQSGGGISVQVRSIRSHLQSDGIESTIFSTKGSILLRLAAPFLLVKEGRGYDVFHIHACSNRGFFPAVVGILVGKLLKKKIVLTYHGGDADAFFARHTKFVKFFLCRVDTNVVLSGFIAKVFDKYDLQYVVIPNGVDVQPGRFLVRSSIGPRFICIRSHTEIYNIGCILEAYNIVSSRYPESSLTFLGDGSLHEELKKRSADMGLKNVRFAGRVDNSAIYDYLNQADIMLSSPIIDNMPVSLLEGFNSGLLVISSNVGGVPYMIEDGKNGLLFESGNSKELADRILEALSDYSSYLRMVNNAFDSLQAYSWDNVWRKLRAVYGY